tara:strand:- start:17691 stop:18806 length:1116 start_codon:yes stop_codon:yes gene_type:complete
VQSPKIYKISNIEVDRTSDTAAHARQQAIIEAHRQAFNQLLIRMVPSNQLTLVPRLTHEEIVSMVQSFGIDEEKTSSVRYIGDLSFQFRRMEVRQFLRSAGVSFAETKSKPILFLPVLDSIGAKLLWDVPNLWFEAWKVVLPSGGLVPLKLPVGDLVDIRDLTAEQAATGAESQIEIIGRRYGAGTVIVVEAMLDTVTSNGQRNINVSLRYFGGPWADRTDIRTFMVKDGESVSDALARTALEIAWQIEEDWKRDNILQLDRTNNLIAEVALSELQDWVVLRRSLEDIALVHNIELIMISRRDATIRLTYFGTKSQLKTTFEQHDLLLERKAANWELRNIVAPSSKSDSSTEILREKEAAVATGKILNQRH